MRRTMLDEDMAIDEIMRRWPVTIRVFLQHRMLCVGCPIGVFHTVAEASGAHGLDREVFSAQLLGAMRGEPVAATASGAPPAEWGRLPGAGCGS